MRALDLFCGGGGAGAGLIQAGYDVVGIDKKDCPTYPGRFIKADAIKPPVRLDDFDFVWASPPCQKFSLLNRPVTSESTRAAMIDYIALTRELLAGHPVTCIENVPSAPVRPDIVLTGGMFELDVIRRRNFEISWFALTPQIQLHRRGAVLRGEALCIVTSPGAPATDIREARIARGLPRNYSIKEKSDAMRISHSMTHRELGECIPPAYARYIGQLALDEIRRRN